MTPELPPSRTLSLPGRGDVLVREHAGPPGAPTLVLLHGWTVSSDLNWYPVFDRLGERYRVLAFDHRGHGRGGIRSHVRFTLEDAADDAAAVADVLGIDRFVPVGYSMGGLVAQLVWRRHADRVGGLVLCATATHFVDGALDRMRFGLLEPGILLTRAARDQRARELWARAVALRTGGRGYNPWVVEELLTGDPRHMLEAGSAIGRFDSRSWIGGIDVPTSVVVTEPDVVVHSWRQRSLAAAVPGARSFVSPGGHDVVVTAPEAFVPVLLAACEHTVTAAAMTAPGRP
jgi:3-oxoadipate enol-lactonase